MAAPPRRTPMRLYHFSPERLDVIDPAHYGRNPWTSTQEVNSALHKRAYFYRDTARPGRPANFEPEGVVMRDARWGHEVEVSLRIYDFGKDRLDFVSKVDAGMTWSEVEKRLAAAGYEGFTNTDHFYPHMRSTIVVWKPVPVRRSWSLEHPQNPYRPTPPPL